jgi:tRNA/tmRNA/rRNA uracil-C5-methylase (TrmA/RlmC/RlmD family)
VSLAPRDILTLDIEDVAFGGQGVGRADDFVVFVPFVAVGESVKVEITEVKKRYARSRLLEVLKASPQRRPPECRYFGECGGCQYQHLDYPAQLALKEKQVRDLFQRVGNMDPSRVGAIVGCSQPYGYRNRIMVRTQWDKVRHRLNLGYLRAANRLVIDVEECPIAEPALNQQLQNLRANPPPKGGFKVVLRIPPEDWEVPPDSFFQNNFFLLPELVNTVRAALLNSGSKHLIDVYCGVGFFALELADMMQSFAGIELDRLAIAAAKRNMARRSRTNGEFIAGTAESTLPQLLSRCPPEETTVVLDPPRKGCQPLLLAALRELRPAQIVYVSCDPATMARDLNVLRQGGVFNVTQIVPLDMFPQTAHVECVADLRLAMGLPERTTV